MSVNRPTPRLTLAAAFALATCGRQRQRRRAGRVRRRQPDQRVQDVAAAYEKSMPAPRWS